VSINNVSFTPPDGAVDDSIQPTSGRIFFLSGDVTRTISVSILPLNYLQGFKVFSLLSEMFLVECSSFIVVLCEAETCRFNLYLTALAAKGEDQTEN